GRRFLLRRASAAPWGRPLKRSLMRRRAKLNAQSETSGRRARIPKRQMCTEATMLREQMITLLQTCVVFLLLTNTASLLAAIYAVRQTRPAPAAQQRTKSAIERNLDAMRRLAG